MGKLGAEGVRGRACWRDGAPTKGFIIIVIIIICIIVSLQCIPLISLLYHAQKDQSTMNIIGSPVWLAALRSPRIPGEIKSAFDESKQEDGEACSRRAW